MAECMLSCLFILPLVSGVVSVSASFLCASSMHSVQTSILYFLIRYCLIAQALLFFSYAYVVLVVNIGQKTSGRSVRRVNTRPVTTARRDESS